MMMQELCASSQIPVNASELTMLVSVLDRDGNGASHSRLEACLRCRFLCTSAAFKHAVPTFLSLLQGKVGLLELIEAIRKAKNKLRSTAEGVRAALGNQASRDLVTNCLLGLHRFIEKSQVRKCCVDGESLLRVSTMNFRCHVDLWLCRSNAEQPLQIIPAASSFNSSGNAQLKPCTDTHQHQQPHDKQEPDGGVPQNGHERLGAAGPHRAEGRSTACQAWSAAAQTNLIRMIGLSHCHAVCRTRRCPVPHVRNHLC